MGSNIPAINTWYIVIGGYLQREGEPNGMVRLWRWLHGRHTSSVCRVEFRTWNDRFESLVELIWLLRPNGRATVIYLYGYSWGGMSAVLLARQLQQRGIRVKRLTLADAVYRHWYWLGQWRALVPWSRIKIPSNVQEVSWMRQTMGWPCGHNLVAVDPQQTMIHGPLIGSVNHYYMDDELADQLIAGQDIIPVITWMTSWRID